MVPVGDSTPCKPHMGGGGAPLANRMSICKLLTRNFCWNEDTACFSSTANNTPPSFSNPDPSHSWRSFLKLASSLAIPNSLPSCGDPG